MRCGGHNHTHTNSCAEPPIARRHASYNAVYVHRMWYHMVIGDPNSHAASSRVVYIYRSLGVDPRSAYQLLNENSQANGWLCVLTGAG